MSAEHHEAWKAVWPLGASSSSNAYLSVDSQAEPKPAPNFQNLLEPVVWSPCFVLFQATGETQVPGSEQILLDILEHDWKEAQDDRQELCQKLHSVQNELQWAEELRDKVI